MRETKESLDPFQNYSDEELAEIVKSNDAWDKVEQIMREEDIEEKERINKENKPYRRIRRSPLEIINRIFFFLFIVSFIVSFISTYAVNRWWFFWYTISAFSCILYTPNRKALKELIDAWPNIEDLIRNRSLWKK